MTYRLRLVFGILAVCFSLNSLAQKISYSEPEREDSRRTNFEIIGRVGGNILVFKNNRNNNDISVYDNDMKLIERVDLDYMSDRWINVDFVQYTDHAWMIYQYQQRNVVYCMGVKIDSRGKTIGEPLELDTTRIGWSANNKIYSTIFSDDKQRIMIFKINNRAHDNFVFTTLLFNDQMQLQDKHRLNMPMEERNDYFTDFLVDNDGDMVFGKYIRKSGSDYTSGLKLVVKPATRDQFIITDLKNEDRFLDDIKIKIDNTNKRFIFNAFYYQQKRGNIEGLYTIVWDKGSQGVIKETLAAFNDDLRRQAKGPDANLRLAFNDYFIKNIITKKDGGYLMISESNYTTSRGGAFNRWDYMGWNNPWMSPMSSYYWSPYYSPFGSPYNRYGYGNNATRYHAENIMIISFNKDGGVDWSNVIPKTQYDDESDALISTQLMNTGGELHFLFNQYEKRTLLLNDQSIDGDGKITRHPTLRGLDRGIEFMPRYGKQISARVMLVPCQYRNYLTFAKMEF